jgi:hypothetical protein
VPRRLVVALALSSGWGPAAAGQGLPCPEFPVNAYTTDSQRFASVASAPDGDFVVVWEHYAQPGGRRSIYGRRFDASGSPLGGDFRVNTNTLANTFRSNVAVDAGGNFVVVWDAGWIFGQRYDASGAAQGPEFRVNTYTATFQQYPAAAFGRDGNFVVVWQSHGQDGSDFGVFGQRFDAAGAAQGPEFQVNVTTHIWQREPSIAVQSNGDFVVVWGSYEQDGDLDGLIGRRFSAGGVPLTGEFPINSYTTGPQRSPKVVPGPAGGFVVVWATPDGDGYGIAGRRFDSSGVAQGPEFPVNTATTNFQYQPALAAIPGGGYVVVWTDTDASSVGVSGRRLDASGAPAGAVFPINTYTTLSQWWPSVAGAPTGGFVAVWESGAQDGDGFGIFGSVDCARLHTVSPCRLVDTRDPPASPLAANSTRVFPVAGACGIPADARAIAVNATAVNPADLGNLRLYPAGAAAPLASSLNFSAGVTRANNAIVSLGTDGQIAVQCDMPPGSIGQTHFVLDVYGYFKR